MYRKSTSTSTLFSTFYAFLLKAKLKQGLQIGIFLRFVIIGADYTLLFFDNLKRFPQHFSSFLLIFSKRNPIKQAFLFGFFCYNAIFQHFQHLPC